MILQALTRYYEDLLSRGEIAAPGWAPAKISLALYINENGELTQIVPTMVEGTKGKKTVMQPQLMVLPGDAQIIDFDLLLLPVDIQQQLTELQRQITTVDLQ